MAVCAYILDKNDNLLLTKRPDWLKIFPNVWVMPGGIVEYQERMDIGLFREIEEEIGLTFEYVDDKNPDENVKMISPLRFDHPSDEIEANMKPFYLYESVTRHLFD
jgi:8-oxo-dGTP pyrophosphatase MutT (NUDIX family)